MNVNLSTGFILFNLIVYSQAAPAQETSYQQPASTGNLYYYYYPVAAQPIVEKADDDDELDPLVLVLIPITMLIGLLALLSIFSK